MGSCLLSLLSTTLAEILQVFVGFRTSGGPFLGATQTSVAAYCRGSILGPPVYGNPHSLQTQRTRILRGTTHAWDLACHPEEDKLPTAWISKVPKTKACIPNSRYMGRDLRHIGGPGAEYVGKAVPVMWRIPLRMPSAGCYQKESAAVMIDSWPETIPQGPCTKCGIYLGLKGVPISLLWGLSLYLL